MLVVNMFGGPCSGKSTSAAAVFAYLKNRGIRAELVHEAAKRFYYKGSLGKQGENQAYILAKQWSAIYDLDKAGATVAISDSPLVCNLAYATHLPYFEELKALAVKLDNLIPQVNIFVKRTKEFDSFGRTQQTIEEAIPFDDKARSILLSTGRTFDLEAEGTEEGQREMGRFVMAKISDLVGFKGTGAHHE
jgi:hypothetical protein